MQMSLRTMTVLALAMFVLMWLGAIAQSPGGMSAFAHEIASVEQEVLQPPSEHPVQTTGANGQQETFDTYPGGIICEHQTGTAGEPEDSNCQVPVPMFPY
jgi:hypothetical protein